LSKIEHTQPGKAEGRRMAKASRSLSRGDGGGLGEGAVGEEPLVEDATSYVTGLWGQRATS